MGYLFAEMYETQFGVNSPIVEFWRRDTIRLKNGTACPYRSTICDVSLGIPMIQKSPHIGIQETCFRWFGARQNISSLAY